VVCSDNHYDRNWHCHGYGTCGTPIFGREPGLAPPAKGSRPEGMPEAGLSLAPYLPPPVEDDDIVGGGDDLGMAPEVVVNLKEEVEDLNTDLISMDRQLDSPHPLSPSTVAALDRDLSTNNVSAEAPFDVLHVVPSTQPETPPPPAGVSARQLRSRSRRRVTGNAPPVPPLMALAPHISDSEQRPATGRGILHLRAPPKLARMPAPRRRPPPCAELPLPQWTTLCHLRRLYSTEPRRRSQSIVSQRHRISSLMQMRISAP